MKLTCDMVLGCAKPVTHIDDKGYVYCTDHGQDRQRSRRCRKMTDRELSTLRAGGTIKKF